MSNFNEIEHVPLQAYNRCVYAFNILEDCGKAPMEEYLSQFSAAERQNIAKVYSMVKDLGPKRTRAIVTHDVEFSNEDWKEEDEG